MDRRAQRPQAGRQLERVRAVAPGLTDDAILAIARQEPVDIEAQNRHMVHGTFHGGDRTHRPERRAAPRAGVGPVPACRSPASTRPAARRTRAGSITGAPGAQRGDGPAADLGLDLEEVVAVPDARVQAAIDNWAPRFTTNGVDPNDFRTTTARIERWDEWLDAWCETAEAHRALAEEARAERPARTAGEAFVRAAVCFHFAKFVWVVDAERNRATTERAIAALYAAHALLDPTAERVEAPLDGGRVAGNLRRPRGRRRAAARRPDPGPRLDQGGVLPLGGHLPRARDGDAVARRPGPGRDRLRARHPARLRGRGRRDPRRARARRRTTSTSSASARRASASAATTRRARPRSRSGSGRSPASAGRTTSPRTGTACRASRARRSSTTPARRRRRRRASAPRS